MDKASREQRPVRLTFDLKGGDHVERLGAENFSKDDRRVGVLYC